MRFLLALLLCGSVSVSAHEVLHEVATAQAVVVRLHYADGSPFSYEAYELYPPGQSTPTQVGRTDSEGRVIFLPGSISQWRLRAFSADGHGVEQTLSVPAAAQPLPVSTAEPGRASLALFGLSLLLGGFGLYQLFLRREKSS